MTVLPGADVRLSELPRSTFTRTRFAKVYIRQAISATTRGRSENNRLHVTAVQIWRRKISPFDPARRKLAAENACTGLGTHYQRSSISFSRGSRIRCVSLSLVTFFSLTSARNVSVCPFFSPLLLPCGRPEGIRLSLETHCFSVLRRKMRKNVNAAPERYCTLLLVAVTASIDANVRNDANRELSRGHTRGPEPPRTQRNASLGERTAGSGERKRSPRRTQIVHTTHARRIVVTSDRRHALPLLGRGISRDGCTLCGVQLRTMLTPDGDFKRQS